MPEGQTRPVHSTIFLSADNAFEPFFVSTILRIVGRKEKIEEMVLCADALQALVNVGDNYNRPKVAKFLVW